MRSLEKAKKYEISLNIMKSKIRKNRKSSELLKIVPEKPTIEEGLSLSGTLNNVTQISPDQMQEESLRNCCTWPENEAILKFQGFLDSTKVTIVMSIVTIYTLFAPDVQILAFPKSADDIFSGIIVACLFLFSVEFVLSCYAKPDYSWSFYFWLDLIATLSLIADLSWIWNSFIGTNSNSTARNKLNNAKKASSAGTKTSRALRIIRLVRLIRLVKLYKSAKIALEKKKKKENQQEHEKILGKLPEEKTKVGKTMSDLTMKRVILIVLFLLIMLPFFSIEFYYSALTSWQYGLIELGSFINLHGFEQVKNEYIAYHVDDIRPLIFLGWKNETNSYVWQHGISYEDLRFAEIYFCSYSNLISIFDIRYDAKLTSLLNIMKTIFIAIILILGSIYFTKDAEELVLTPIDKIIKKLKKIAKNPISASEIKSSTESTEKEFETTCFCCKEEKNSKAYEMVLIENTIIKIGILLALGFGEAGSAIIGQNVQQSGQVNPMSSGSKVVGIFGFCDIRNFTDTTEELQEGVMMFVNEIAQIVHGVVDKYFGSANKNIGDAFLVVWKFTPEEFYLDSDIIIRNHLSKRAYYLPDMALLSFLKILAKINKDPTILKYRNHRKIIERMPNYEVKMGFGLHLGWAIEGPIGSQFKVDASYLSPHVNIASNLEGSTKVYGVPLLISGPLYDYFSPGVQRFCRNIDVVKFKGAKEPIALYTSDCDFSGFNAGKIVSRKKNVYRKKKKHLKLKLENQQIDAVEMFLESNEIKLMRKGLSHEFFQMFSVGLEDYYKGEWGTAKENFEKGLELKNKDGPTLSLINFMSQYGFKAPDSWEGERFLG